MSKEPTFTRVMYVGLSVRDVRRSADWYREVLDFETERANIAGSAWPSSWDEVLLTHRDSGLLLGLLQHPENNGDTFSEFRTGLDHMELEVSTMEQLQMWRARFDELGIAHSAARPYLVTFRDPDNIQLELYCPSGREPAA